VAEYTDGGDVTSLVQLTKRLDPVSETTSPVLASAGMLPKSSAAPAETAHWGMANAKVGSAMESVDRTRAHWR
jgi:hypothetical protein